MVGVDQLARLQPEPPRFTLGDMSSGNINGLDISRAVISGTDTHAILQAGPDAIRNT